MNQNLQSKINKIKGQAKLDGFRKGNVPNDVLEQRYGRSIHYEVVNELNTRNHIPKHLKKTILDQLLRQK